MRYMSVSECKYDCSKGTTAGKNTLQGHFNILPYNARTSYNNNDIFVGFSDIFNKTRIK